MPSTKNVLNAWYVVHVELGLGTEEKKKILPLGFKGSLSSRRARWCQIILL